MKYLLSLMLLTMFTSLTASDQLIAEKAQTQDLELFKVWSKSDDYLRSHYRQVELLLGENYKNQLRHECEEDQANGSSACWEKCSKDNWSTSTCAGLCGTASAQGSKACWKKCNTDNWSTQHCASLCGTNSGAGSEVCWGKCVSDNWSLNTCANQCGVLTSKGSNACWKKCNADNYSTQHCASVCKLN